MRRASDAKKTINFGPVTAAAAHHFREWVLNGTLPPAQTHIESAGDPPEIVRDQNGALPPSVPESDAARSSSSRLTQTMGRCPEAAAE